MIHEMTETIIVLFLFAATPIGLPCTTLQLARLILGTRVLYYLIVSQYQVLQRIPFSFVFKKCDGNYQKFMLQTRKLKSTTLQCSLENFMIHVLEHQKLRHNEFLSVFFKINVQPGSYKYDTKSGLFPIIDMTSCGSALA